MANDETPEERLKKYKERLAKMVQEDEMDSPSDPVKEEKVEKRKPHPPQPTAIEEPIGARPKPPAVLESPAKRELRESQVVKKRREDLVEKIQSTGRKNRIMLKARQKAIDNQLQEIKSRKSLLELQYKRKVINRTDYDQRMKLLVEEGRDLLKEKSEIDKSLAR